MASMLDYFTPGQMPAAQPDQNIMPSVATFMNDPRALNALLAFGTQAMIPQWGGGTVQFAKGVGAAGEAASANEESARKQQEADSKAQLREAQAGKAEAQAGASSARLDSSAQRLALETFKQGEISKRNELGRRVALSGMYQKYIGDVQKRNNDVMRPQGAPPEQVLPMEQWIQANPMLKNLGLVPGGPEAPSVGEDATLPAGAEPTQATTPAAPAVKQPGMTQIVKSGQYVGKEVQWDGTKWQLTGR
jgi:hypothetical protein